MSDAEFFKKMTSIIDGASKVTSSKKVISESKKPTLLEARKSLIVESRKLISLAETANIPKSLKNVYIAEAAKAIELIRSGLLSESQLKDLEEGVFGGLKALGGAAANALGRGASAAGQAIAGKAQQAGQAVSQGADALKGAVSKAGQAVAGTAQQAGQAIAGKAQQAGQAVAGTAQQAGQAIAKGADAVKSQYQAGSNREDAKNMLSSVEGMIATAGKLGLNVNDSTTIGNLKKLLSAAGA